MYNSFLVCYNVICQHESLSLHKSVQSLIGPEIRSVVRHASSLKRNGCTAASESFATFAYNKLSTAALLPDGLTLDDFSPCSYLDLLQQLLFTTNELDMSVTYETFVVVPESLNTTLYNQFGNETDFNGSFVSVFEACLIKWNRYEEPSSFPFSAIRSYWKTLGTCLFVA